MPTGLEETAAETHQQKASAATTSRTVVPSIRTPPPTPPLSSAACPFCPSRSLQLGSTACPFPQTIYTRGTNAATETKYNTDESATEIKMRTMICVLGGGWTHQRKRKQRWRHAQRRREQRVDCPRGREQPQGPAGDLCWHPNFGSRNGAPPLRSANASDACSGAPPPPHPRPPRPRSIRGHVSSLRTSVPLSSPSPRRIVIRVSMRQSAA